MKSQSEQKHQQPAKAQPKKAEQKSNQLDSSAQVAAMLSAVGGGYLPQLGGSVALSAGELGNQAMISFSQRQSDLQSRVIGIGSILSGAEIPTFSQSVPQNDCVVGESFSPQSVPQFSNAPVCDFSAAEAVAAPFA